MFHRYPVSALQRFGQVRTPAPPWVAVHHVIIYQRTLVQAANYLIEALGGSKMSYKIAGGRTWWQVRAGPGVEAEWIVMKKDWKDAQKEDRLRASDGMVDADGGVSENGECKLLQRGLSWLIVLTVRRELDELRCMLYSA